MEVLEAEIETYYKHQKELLATDKGRYVLIHGTEVAGRFESKADAIAAGYEKFGNEPFLVKQVLEVETPLNFTSHLLRV